MLISETHLIKKHYFKIPTFTVYHTMHPDGTTHGGTAIIMKNNIRHHELDKYNKDFLQATTIKVEDRAGTLVISSIYYPPKHTITSEQFGNSSKLWAIDLAVRDYNAKHQFWGSRLANPKGSVLYKAITNERLEIISQSMPTYWPSDRKKIPDIIDFGVAKGIIKLHFEIKSSLELSSDHSLLIISISSKIIAQTQPCSLHNKRTNWQFFRDEIESTLNLQVPLKDQNDIMHAVEHINLCIQQAAWNSTPSSITRNQNTVIPVTIREKLKEKRNLRKQWQTHRFPKLKTKLNKN